MSAAEATRLRKIALADKLGVSRPTLDRYLAMEGAPTESGDKMYDVEAVAKFIQANLPTGPGGPQGNLKGTAEEKLTLAGLKIEKLSLECQKLRHAIEVDRGDYISKREAAAVIIPVMSELGSLLTQKFEMELPSRCVGKDAVEIAQLNAEGIDKVIKRFKTGMAPFMA